VKYLSHRQHCPFSMMRAILVTFASFTAVHAQLTGTAVPPPTTMDLCGVSVLTLVSTILLKSLPPQRRCVDGVYNNAKKPSGPIKCFTLEKQCLCSSQDFWNGLQDCATQACKGNVLQQVADWKDNVLCTQNAATSKTTQSTKAPSTTKTDGA
jgi:hypothetical protein